MLFHTHNQYMIVGILCFLKIGLSATNHREHKVHNIVLYPDKHSWCKTTEIKQVINYPGCTSAEIDNNVCVGACFSYSIPHTEPSDPGEVIVPYCDSCQPSVTTWQQVKLKCDDQKSDAPAVFVKNIQFIQNCTCKSCEKRINEADEKMVMYSKTNDVDEEVDDNTGVANELLLLQNAFNNYSSGESNVSNISAVANDLLRVRRVHHIIEQKINMLLEKVQSNNLQSEKEQLLDLLHVLRHNNVGNRDIENTADITMTPNTSIADIVNDLESGQKLKINDVERIQNFLQKLHDPKATATTINNDALEVDVPDDYDENMSMHIHKYLSLGLEDIKSDELGGVVGEHQHDVKNESHLTDLKLPIHDINENGNIYNHQDANLLELTGGTIENSKNSNGKQPQMLQENHQEQQNYRREHHQLEDPAKELTTETENTVSTFIHQRHSHHHHQNHHHQRNHQYQQEKEVNIDPSTNVLIPAVPVSVAALQPLPTALSSAHRQLDVNAHELKPNLGGIQLSYHSHGASNEADHNPLL